MFGPPEAPQMYEMLEEHLDGLSFQTSPCRIGFGVTSKVYKCRKGKEIYAVKAISLKRLRHQPCYARVVDRLHQEIEILLSLKHKHIVKLVDVVGLNEIPWI